MARQKGKSRKHGQESKHKRTHKVKQDYDYDYSPIRTVIVSHVDVCKNKFTYHLSDKTHGFGWRFIHSGGASSVILRTRERAAHVTSHMIVCCK